MSFGNPETVQKEVVSSPRSIIIASRLGSLLDDFIIQPEDSFSQKYQQKSFAQKAYQNHIDTKQKLLKRAIQMYNKLPETYITEQEFKYVGQPPQLEYLLKFPVSSPQLMMSSMLKLSNNDMNLALRLRREKEQQESEKNYHKQREVKLAEIEKRREEARIAHEEEVKEHKEIELAKKQAIEQKNIDFMLKKEQERIRQQIAQDEMDRKYKQQKAEEKAILKQQQEELNEKMQQKRDKIFEKQNQIYLSRYERFQQNLQVAEAKLDQIMIQKELKRQQISEENARRTMAGQQRLENVKEERAMTLWEMQKEYDALDLRHQQQLENIRLMKKEEDQQYQEALLAKTDAAHKRYNEYDVQLQKKGEILTRSYNEQQSKFVEYKQSIGSSFEQSIFEKKLKMEEAKINAERARRAKDYKASMTASRLAEKMDFVEQVISQRDKISNENQQLCVRMSAIKQAPVNERAALEKRFMSGHVDDIFDQQNNMVLSAPSGTTTMRRPMSASGSLFNTQKLAEHTLSEVNQPTFSQRHTKAEYDALNKDVGRKRAHERQALLDAAIREQEAEERRRIELQQCQDSQMKLQLRMQHAEERAVANKELRDLRQRHEWEIMQVQSTTQRRFGNLI